ncbi:DNA-methyltransferase [Candidatus Nanohalococcus occultus]|uniref:DNA-methyltransferase n=1 Tax=Candidatus Nanohalococcus occultus TaxID=2978047 RepID=UPI0039E136DC
MPEAPRNQIIAGDCVEEMKKLPDDSVDLVITSPPYFNQRDYDMEGQIGREEDVEEYIDRIHEVFKECVRVTKESGSMVFNMGDKRVDNGRMLIPSRFATRMIDNEPVKLVNDITWHKTNPTPRQSDRTLTRSTEPFFHFALSKDYKHDIREYQKHLDIAQTKIKGKKRTDRYGKKYFELIEESDLSQEEKQQAEKELQDAIDRVHNGDITGFRMKIRGVHALPYGGQEGGRMQKIRDKGFTIIDLKGNKMKTDVIESSVESIDWSDHPAIYPEYIIRHLLRLLTDKGDLVLDPFMGSGTTAVAAKKLNRDYLGYDLNPEYCEKARQRVNSINAETKISDYVGD